MSFEIDKEKIHLKYFRQTLTSKIFLIANASLCIYGIISLIKGVVGIGLGCVILAWVLSYAVPRIAGKLFCLKAMSKLPEYNGEFD
jgi:hypothetical protein